MNDRNRDLRDCLTAYDCRDRLPALAEWMTDEQLKQLPIWHGRRFERGEMYFDLDNPERGPFVATGDEGPPTDHTYVARNEVSVSAWAHLVAWREGLTPEQAMALEDITREQGERGVAGEAGSKPGE